MRRTSSSAVEREVFCSMQMLLLSSGAVASCSSVWPQVKNIQAKVKSTQARTCLSNPVFSAFRTAVAVVVGVVVGMAALGMLKMVELMVRNLEGNFTRDREWYNCGACVTKVTRRSCKSTKYS